MDRQFENLAQATPQNLDELVRVLLYIASPSEMGKAAMKTVIKDYLNNRFAPYFLDADQDAQDFLGEILDHCICEKHG